MPHGTILFVHGTGTRLKDYQPTFRLAARKAEEFGIRQKLAECAWGDAFGADFELKSVPGARAARKAQAQADDDAQWSYLYHDPLFEIRLLQSPDPNLREPPTPPGKRPPHEVLWATITNYEPSVELNALLERGGLSELWQPAWESVVLRTDDVRKAVYASRSRTAEPAMALARALAAEVTQAAIEKGLPAPGSGLRNSIVDRLRTDWGQQVYGLGTLFKSFVTALIRERRDDLSEKLFPIVGDILLYQGRGEKIREFIRQKIEKQEKPVYLLAHSLGGIACVDLLMPPNRPDVKGLITAGSQAPLFYELGALQSLASGPLPDGFPAWLNIFDPNDLLSYVAGPVFPEARDVEVQSGDLPGAAHSAYWNLDKTWEAIRDFVK